MAAELNKGSVDVADMFTTSSAIGRNQLVQLEDPKQMILPQNVIPLVRAEVADNATATAALDAVQAALTTEDLIALNSKVDDDNQDPDEVAKEWLTSKGLAVNAGVAAQRSLTLFSGEATPRRSCRAVQHRPAPPGPFPPDPARRQPSGLRAQRVPVPEAAARPRLTVTTVASGLTIPWDVTWVGDVMLFNERGGRVWSKRGGSAARSVAVPLSDLYASGEGGLVGMVADPGARTNHRFYVCYASQLSGHPRDVRVVRWRLTSDITAVLDGANPVVVSGLPVSVPDGTAAAGCGSGPTASLHRHRGRGHRLDPAGSGVSRRQGAAGELGRLRPCREPVLQPGRQRPVCIQLRPPQLAGAGVPAGDQRAVERRARNVP